MINLSHNLQTRLLGQRQVHFNAPLFLREKITRSWLLMAWLVVLTAITIGVTRNQLVANPITTIIVLVIWAVGVVWTVFNEITRTHTSITWWLRNNLFNSITNIQLTLLLTLLLIAFFRGFIDYAVVRATITTDPDQVAVLRTEMREAGEEPGANWGAVAANFRNLMVFRFPRAESWRLWAILIMVAALAGPSTVIYSRPAFRRSPIRRIMTVLWFLSPIVTFFLLRGFGPLQSFLPVLNPEVVWGGLLLTVVIAIFGIVASFPLGVLLALGRRSKIHGIPAWLTYGATILLAIYFLVTSTTTNLSEARSFSERALAFWPLLIVLIGYLFQRYFNGNVVALFSTVYIESWRGVPFITVLFMSIILFPILLPPGVEILGTYRVLAATALFAAAYLAENVRGGLQNIPNGQYEAADSLGLSTYKKYRLIIMPQALRVVIPAIVGQFIGLFKDTSLVAIVGLIDLLGAANLISSQPAWLGVRREPYLFIALVYFVGSAVMAGYSRRLEARLGVGER
jgi:general L-amino acid transport system permease protein